MFTGSVLLRKGLPAFVAKRRSVVFKAADDARYMVEPTDRDLTSRTVHDRRSATFYHSDLGCCSGSRGPSSLRRGRRFALFLFYPAESLFTISLKYMYRLLRNRVIALLHICAFKVFRKCSFQDGLMRLVGFGGVDSQAAVGRAVKGQRQSLGIMLGLFFLGFWMFRRWLRSAPRAARRTEAVA